VLPNTVTPGYGPRPRREDLVARLGLGGKRIVLTVGRLSALERYTGHDRLIAALPAIAARVPDAAYLIVGSGDDRPRLERLAHEAGVGDRVVFAGHVPDPELPDYFALAHVFAMPSTGEGFGIAFLEAAASGLPVIGGNCDGSVDALADGQIGRLVDPNAPGEIVGAVIDALLGRHPVTAGAQATRRFAFARFAAHVDALVSALVR
jgi:glycosyltransferase involved in cell wall biosynthesis